MLRRASVGLLSIWAGLVALTGVAVRAADIAVPRELEEWRGWVMQDEAHRQCPFLYSASPGEPASHRCVWPERLSLSLSADGGTFSQRFTVGAESWVRLPGNLEHWPQDVRINGEPAAVVAREQSPQVLLTSGAYLLTGRLSWAARPESLAIDPRTALLDLTLDGRQIAQPERPNGAVWLGKRRSAEQPQRVEVQVYRLLNDEIPARLETRIRLQVAGEGREELLARALPEGFTPVSLESELPARLDAEGRLNVQARAGEWEINLTARGANVASRLARPPIGEGQWAREEVWSFAGEDRLRVAAAQGADGIDAAQANVPPEWRGHPAFRMAADSVLTVVERTRGLQHADDNRLGLRRELWLDFDHGGFIAVDTLSGVIRKDWRLDMSPPFALASARAGEETLLITQSRDGRSAGIEIRSPEPNITAIAHISAGRGALPATGWNGRFENVRGQLHLPPGHLLVAAPGADSAPLAWIERWGLWGVFGVLVVAVFTGWLAGWPVGVVALVGLLLTYQESPSYIWLWSNLLAALALARAAPEGRLKNFARSYRTVSFVVLGFALLPFLWGQARLALYPELDVGAYRAGISEGLAAAPPPPPPAPVAEIVTDAITSVEQEAAANVVRRQAAKSVSSGLNYAQVVQRYAPGTVLQTGPGVPRWQYKTYSYQWSGPVEADQTVRFVYAGPLLLGVWRIAGVLLLAALFVALLQASDGVRWQGKWLQRLRPPRASAASLLAVLILGALSVAEVQAAPEQAVLDELKARLTRPPACVPNCAEVMSARVTATGTQLDITLDVSVLENVAVPIPGAGDRWQIDNVTVDGKSTPTVAREGNESLWMPLSKGAHTVRISGALPPLESFQLAFPAPPRHISFSSDAWEATGINGNRLRSGALELVRKRASSSTTTDAYEKATDFPPFVRVYRQFDLGLDWTLATRIQRESPSVAAFSTEVPLLAGESPFAEGLEVRQLAGATRTALVGFERGQNEFAWSSGLARSETLELELPAGSPRAEVWSFTVSPQWNVEFEGFPAVLPERPNAPQWVYEFHPRPGEKLRLRITRPQAVKGATLAIDSVNHRVEWGKRSSSNTLALSYRSTQGGRHVIKLPQDARVTAVTLDSRAVQLRPDNGELSIGLLPGSHSIEVNWSEPRGVGLRAQPSAVDLQSAASNITTRLQLPEDRWALLAAGPGVGPAIVYWAELAIFFVTALLLGRSKYSPLRVHEWLLLGLGLSTSSWTVLVTVALWLFALRWRESWAGDVSRRRFNFVQVALAGLTIVAVSGLVFWGIRESLLSSPDMAVVSSDYGAFTWFMDRTASVLPRPEVVSVPMWIYRALMFAWALWIVVALLRWLRWAWSAWKTGGIWRSV